MGHGTKMLLFAYVPFIILETWFCVWGSKQTFGFDRTGIKIYGNGMVVVGQIMQYLIIYFVIRDWYGVVKAFTSGFPSVFVALGIKLQFCCLD